MRRDPLTGLFVHPDWPELTDDQRRIACNGAGPQHWPSWARRLLDSVLWWAHGPVAVHDIEYAHGRSRFMADFRLLVNCFMRGRFYHHHLMTIIIFLAVRIGGRKPWREGHAPCDHDI